MPTDANLGKLTVFLEANMRQFASAMARAELTIKNFGARAQSMLTSIGTKLTRFFRYALPAASIFSIREFAKFDRQMAMVNTMLDKQTSHFLPRYNQALRQMAVTYGESTATLSKGLYDILSASIPAGQALDVLTTSVKAAKAGFSDTAVAADAITTIINSYRLSVDKAADVSDLLFAIVKKGKITFPELASNIGKVAAIASTANLSLEELGAALSTMTRAGLQADIAITSLRAILLAFLDPQSEAIEAAEQFGLELNSNTLRALGLTGVMKKLSMATAEELAAIVPTSRAIAGFAAILKNAADQTEDLAFMTNRSGLTMEAYTKATANLGFTLDKTWQLLKAAARTIGEEMAPAVEDLANALDSTSDKWGWFFRTQTQGLAEITSGFWGLRTAVKGYLGLPIGEPWRRKPPTAPQKPRATIEPEPSPTPLSEYYPGGQYPAWLERNLFAPLETPAKEGGAQRSFDLMQSYSNLLNGIDNAYKKASAAAREMYNKTAEGFVKLIARAKEYGQAIQDMTYLRDLVATEAEIFGKVEEPLQHARLIVQHQRSAAIAFGKGTEQYKKALQEFSGLIDELELAEKWRTVADTMRDSFTNAADAILFEAETLRDAVTSILRDIGRQMARQFIFSPLSQLATNWVSSSLPIPAKTAHSGWAVGSGFAERRVPALAFASAPRLHQGLASDEYPAILQRGETVLPAGQPTDVRIELVNQTSTKMTMTEGPPRLDISGPVRQVILQDIAGGNGPISRAIDRRIAGSGI